MIKTIQSIILDFQDLVLETGIPRRLEIKAVPGKATVCIGVRRSGKSTYLYQVIHNLISNGTPKENILFLNFFDDRLHFLGAENIGLITEAYFGLYPHKKNSETIYCFFDKIQSINGWEPFVDRLQRTENCEIFVAGSSAKMLSKEIATQMRGRALSWEVFPFSFREFLDFKNISVPEILPTKKRLLIQKAFEEYWQTGGFPEVLGLDKHLRIKIHQEYFHAVLFKDLVERYDISHPKAVMDLAHRLMDNAASLYTVNSLTGYLKSMGHKAPKSAISNYLSWFEDAYFLFTVRLYDASLARSNANPKKIYCIDHAMINSISSGILINAGHLLENLVFTSLRRISPEIFYYKTKTGHKVDFIAQLPDETQILVQACETIKDPKTRDREISALSAAMSEQNHTTGFIVTRHEDQEIEVPAGRISVIPAWRFLLFLQDSKLPV
jgi:uncharacterized protein